MKKMIAVLITVLSVISIFTVSFVNSSARNYIISPEASTYTHVDSDDDKKPYTRKFTTRPAKPGAGDSTDKSSGGSGSGTTPGGSGTKPGGSGALTSFSFTFKDSSTKPGYTNNAGKDDPKSPNYTGSRTVKGDKSSKSPDTEAVNNTPVIVAFAFCFMCMASVLTIALKRKEEEN